MPSDKSSPPALITNVQDLNHLLKDLRREPVLAIDTESNSLYAYREQVCLLQISTSENDYLIDPLELGDLSPLQPLFSDANIEKVFHAAEYDLICLRRDFGFDFNNLFDTMIAARILGYKQVGLGALLAEYFNVQVEKRYQRANWGQRPLPAHLLDYARQDTRYLIPLRHRLGKALDRKDLLPLACEDFSRLIQTTENGANGNMNPEGRTVDPWRVSGSHDLEPQQAAVLQELCEYRDQVASSSNRPLFKVINDKALLEIALATPQNFSDLERIPALSPRLAKRHGRKLLQAVQRGTQAKPIYPPRSPRPDGDFLDRLEVLRRWRKNTANKLGVASDVVLPRELMVSLARINPGDPAELARVMSPVPWRLEHFGEQILYVLSKGNDK